MQTTTRAARPGAERKRPDRRPKKQAQPKKAGPQTAQQTIPYREIFKDGICRVNDKLYTKSMEYEDINYQLAQADDQSAIFDGYCAFLNSFDSSLPFQLSFINHRSRPESKYKLNIPTQDDEYSEMRSEYVEMLEGQIAKSNNGIVRTKLLTFGVSADSLAAAKPRLERVEADITGNFKKLGVQSRPLSGLERLEILHGQLHPGGVEPFRFTWDMIPKTGMGTKDFIAPTSFDFRQSRLFRMGTTWGAASYMQIMASELSDKLLAELLEVDAEMTITMHIQTVDQAKAIKTIKGKVSDIDKMKVEEQKKAVRSGYDMDILPPDLVTFSQDAKNLLNDLQSRNERMFLLTFLVVNTAATRRPVHGIGYHAEVQLPIEAAGLPAGAGPCVQPPPRLQRYRDTAGHDNQLHGNFRSVYDVGAPHGRRGHLLRPERPFPQCHHGKPQEAEKSQRAVPRRSGERQELQRKAGACQCVPRYQ